MGQFLQDGENGLEPFEAPKTYPIQNRLETLEMSYLTLR